MTLGDSETRMETFVEEEDSELFSLFLRPAHRAPIPPVDPSRAVTAPDESADQKISLTSQSLVCRRFRKKIWQRQLTHRHSKAANSTFADMKCTSSFPKESAGM